MILAERLRTRRTLVCDGAMGTMLHAAGAALDRSLPELNLSDPRLVATIHESTCTPGSLSRMKSSARRVEPAELVASRIRRALEYVPADRLMINPDCGLRHLAPEVAREKLRAMVAGAALVRQEVRH